MDFNWDITCEEVYETEGQGIQVAQEGDEEF